jgi:hypothetical protein
MDSEPPKAGPLKTWAGKTLRIMGSTVSQQLKWLASSIGDTNMLELDLFSIYYNKYEYDRFPVLVTDVQPDVAYETSYNLKYN